MKNSKFIHAGLILILLSACQARKVQTQNASTTTSTQTSAMTTLPKPGDVTKLTIHDSSIGTGVDYIITSTQTENKNMGYLVEIVTKDASGAASSSKQVITEKSATQLFHTIDSIFAGKVKISPTEVKDEQGADKVVASIMITIASGINQTTNNPSLEGEGAESLLEDLAKLSQASRDDDAQPAPTPSDSNVVESNSDNQPRRAAPACQSLNLAGVWEAYIVAQGQVITVTSNIQAGAAAADGSQTYTGTDTANGVQSKRSYVYHTQTCVLEKTLDNNQKKYLKATVVNSIHQRVKLVQCTDESCTRYDPYPDYTDAVILNRVK